VSKTTSSVDCLALLARSVDYGESDRICTLLTDGVGKVGAIARGAKRSRKRFGAALGLFVVGRASLRARRSSELMLLEGFDVERDLSAAYASDVIKMAHGSYLIELTSALWPADSPEPALFELLVEVLSVLAEQAPSSGLLRAYELRVLREVGVGLALDHCGRCGKGICTSDRGPAIDSVIPFFGFSATAGGLICQQCGAHGVPVDPRTRSQLLAHQDVTFDQAARLECSRESRAAMRNLLQMVIAHQLGKTLKSWDFLVQLASKSLASGRSSPAR
jgi:DNA repair protein RecO (recombination protein O)